MGRRCWWYRMLPRTNDCSKRLNARGKFYRINSKNGDRGKFVPSMTNGRNDPEKPPGDTQSAAWTMRAQCERRWICLWTNRNKELQDEIETETPFDHVGGRGGNGAGRGNASTRAGARQEAQHPVHHGRRHRLDECRCLSERLEL